MSHSIESPNHTPSPNLKVWYCANCQMVHFKTGKVMLDFTRSEFKDLTRVLMEIYRKEHSELEFYHLLTSITEDDDVLMSPLVV